MSNDPTTRDEATGEIGGPVFLPLRQRPAPALAAVAAEADASVTAQLLHSPGDAARRRRLPGQRLRFTASR